jgi:carboxypeptidase Taq
MILDSYLALERRYRRIGHLKAAGDVMSWDSQVTMPPGSAAARGEQMATLAVLVHELSTADDIPDLVSAAEAEVHAQEPSADRAWMLANLTRIRRDHIHASAVPADLVEARSKAITASEHAWRTAKKASDFATMRQHLEEVFRLTSRAGEAKAAALGTSVYDALMDEYEPGARSTEIDVVFGRLASFLPGFIDQVIERQSRWPAPIRPTGTFTPERQKELGIHLMRDCLGFDMEKGRLDVSAHPMCIGSPDDVRITTRYSAMDFASGILGVLHETGHALYELNLPARWAYQPVGAAGGMALHESQSLAVEMQACRSRPFVSWLSGKAAQFFGDQPFLAPDSLVRHYTKVARSFIRVEADEATYPLHVIVRYRLEKALVSGGLAVADLPDAWSAMIQDMLGITPPDHAHGCLQDVHWPVGLVGYFPCYTLGAIAASQLFRAAERDGATASIGQGDLKPLVAWMKRHVHERASSADTPQILREATGKGLDADTFISHLNHRYLDS